MVSTIFCHSQLDWESRLIIDKLGSPSLAMGLLFKLHIKKILNSKLTPRGELPKTFPNLLSKVKTLTYLT